MTKLELVHSLGEIILRLLLKTPITGCSVKIGRVMDRVAKVPKVHLDYGHLILRSHYV